MSFRVHIVHEADPRLLMRLDAMHSALERLGGQVATVLKNQGVIMVAVTELDAKLDTILADVADESGQIDSLSTLMTQLKEQIAGLLTGVIPPDVMDKVNAVFAGIETNKAKVVAALNANPAPAPAPTPAPTPSTPTAPSSLSSSGPSAASGT